MEKQHDEEQSEARRTLEASEAALAKAREELAESRAATSSREQQLQQAKSVAADAAKQASAAHAAALGDVQKELTRAQAARTVFFVNFWKMCE